MLGYNGDDGNGSCNIIDNDDDDIRDGISCDSNGDDKINSGDVSGNGDDNN